ncbi:hypothetical protein D9M69_699080 [compost metagenome]
MPPVPALVMPRMPAPAEATGVPAAASSVMPTMAPPLQVSWMAKGVLPPTPWFASVSALIAGRFTTGG